MTRWSRVLAGAAAVAAFAGADRAAAQQFRSELHTQRGGAIIAADEGETRLLSRDRTMLLKVGPENSGASYLFMGSEEIPPGAVVPMHRHEVDEEILIVHRGQLEVTLGDRTAVAEEGAVVFVPVGTWIGLRNPGPGTATIMFIFPRGSVEQCFQYLGSGGDGTRREQSMAGRQHEKRGCQMTYR